MSLTVKRQTAGRLNFSVDIGRSPLAEQKPPYWHFSVRMGIKTSANSNDDYAANQLSALCASYVTWASDCEGCLWGFSVDFTLYPRNGWSINLRAIENGGE
jgi:hypothetical protein